jgi:hypothetical protein
MTRRPLLPVGLHVLFAACAAAPQGSAADADLAITRVSVVDVERGRVLPDQVVLIKGNRIVAVTSASGAQLASNTRRVDGSQKFVIPGLLDMHVHFGLGGADPARMEMPLMVAHGVTGVRVMGADRPSVVPTQTRGLDTHRQWQAQIDAGTLVGPRLLALASWPVNGAAGITDAMAGFFRARTRDEGRQLARYFKERGFDFIKIYNNVPRDGYLGLAEEARRLGLPFGGHEPSALSAIELSNAGQKSVEHSRIFLLNCFPGADSLQKGLLRGIPQTTLRRRMVDEYDPRICAGVFQTFARNGTYLSPTHVTRKMDAFADDSAYRKDARLKYVPLSQQMGWFTDANGMVSSDSSAAGRRSFMDFYKKGLALTNDAYRAGVPVMLGTDAGDTYVFPGGSVHDELGELVIAGLSPAEALKAATLSGATYLGRTRDFGTVQPGRFADLVLLDANPLDDIGNTRRIHAVVMNGRVFARASLDSMLAGVEEAVRPDAQTRLWAASMSGDTVEIARALAAGAKIDSLAGGRRALNWAALNNRGPAVRLLLARGATINSRNPTGFTPVHHAAEGGAIDVLRILIAAGADVTIASNAGARPVDTARRIGNQTAVALLEAAVRRP